jgi:hypothetical protein
MTLLGMRCSPSTARARPLMAQGASMAIRGRGQPAGGGVQLDAAHQTSGSDPAGAPSRVLASVMKTAKSTLPRSTASFSGLVRSNRNFTSRPGDASVSAATTGGRMWSAAWSVVPITNTAGGAAPRRRRASSCAVTILRASASSVTPAGVSRALRPSGSTMGRPTARSSRRMCWLTADWLSRRSAAALRKPPASATAIRLRKGMMSSSRVM